MLDASSSDPAGKPPDSFETDVSGGVNVAAQQVTIGGDVVGRDKITVGYTVEQVSTLLAQISSTFQPKPFDGRCPYLGLDAFSEDDADRFFGRETLIDELVARVKDSRFVVIAGPSGSGKSSLLRAGLIHALKQGSLADSDRWLYATLTPGRDPIESLALAMARMAKSPEAGKYVREHSAEPDALHQFAESQLSDHRDQRAVIFVDQFEEVFTQTSKEDDRAAFLNLLTHTATHENGRVTVLFALRSDFVSNCATYPQLNALLNQQFMQVGAMQPDELVSAIARPALQVGLRIDPDLVAQIVNDMQDEPGALPLMQFALKDLFDAQQAKSGVIALALNDYLARGGLRKALERHADAAFGKLTEGEQQLARSIFTSLIEIGSGRADTRRAASFTELVPASADSDPVQAVIEKLADARLITTAEQDHQETVTISHERLIDAWPWLRKLIDENRVAIALQNEIAGDAQEWDRNQRDASYLYTGARLATAREQLAAQKIVLSGLAQSFVETGIEAEAAERHAEELRRQKELDDARKLAEAEKLRAQEQAQANRRLRRLAVGLGIVLAAALVAVAVAVWQTMLAEHQFRIARAGQLAAQARSIVEDYPQRGLLLAIEALRITARMNEERVPIAEESLRQVLTETGGLPLTGQHGVVFALAFSPDGHWLATGSQDKIVRLWDITRAITTPIELRGHTDSIFALAFSPDGQWLVSGSGDITARVWRIADLTAAPIVLGGQGAGVTAVGFSPDSHKLAIGASNAVRVWNMLDLASSPLVLSGYEGAINTLTFSPDGRWLATGSEDPEVRVWDLSRSTPIVTILSGHNNAVRTSAFSSNGHWLATGSDDHTTRVWNMADLTFSPIVLRGHTDSVSAVAFSPDGHWLAVASKDTTVQMWDTSAWANPPEVLRGHQDAINAIAFSPDGHWLLTGSHDSTARVWDVTNLQAPPVVLRGHESDVDAVAFSQDSQRLATASWDMTARVWKTSDLQAAPLSLQSKVVFPEATTFSPDRSLMAVADATGTVRIWDTANPMHEPIVRQAQPITPSLIAFSANNLTLGIGSKDGTIQVLDIHIAEATKQPLVFHRNDSSMTALAFSPDGLRLATAYMDTSIRVWEVNKPNDSPVGLRGNTDRVTTLAFSSDGQWLTSGGADGKVRLWRVQSPLSDPIVLTGHRNGISVVAFSSDSRWLAIGSDDATISVWDMLNPNANPIVLRGHQYSISALAFSPDGQWLVSGSQDADIRVWSRTRFDTAPLVLRGGTQTIQGLAFSPDGGWLASSSVNEVVRVWDMHNLAAPAVALPDQSIAALAFSPDGHWLITLDKGAIAHAWNMRLNEVVDLACQTVGRNLTQAEWAQFMGGEPYDKSCEQWPGGK